MGWLLGTDRAETSPAQDGGADAACMPSGFSVRNGLSINVRNVSLARRYISPLIALKNAPQLPALGQPEYTLAVGDKRRIKDCILRYSPGFRTLQSVATGGETPAARRGGAGSTLGTAAAKIRFKELGFSGDFKLNLPTL
jgi:hypothetical protein